MNRKLLYQQSMFKALSKHHKWLLYVDDKENIWCYNGDLQDYFVLIFDAANRTYNSHNYKEERLKLPEAFKDALKQ